MRKSEKMAVSAASENIDTLEIRDLLQQAVNVKWTHQIKAEALRDSIFAALTILFPAMNLPVRVEVLHFRLRVGRNLHAHTSTARSILTQPHALL